MSILDMPCPVCGTPMAATYKPRAEVMQYVLAPPDRTDDEIRHWLHIPAGSVLTIVRFDGIELLHGLRRETILFDPFKASFRAVPAAAEVRARYRNIVVGVELCAAILEALRHGES